ncbi:DUF5999 family protein [Streptomyces sp. TR02-1]|uniref:DUF5999 family protein n=1 Tax=Streptomyces sp. TR02-1 TaxID=3385977 RepID=UPI0039A11042
MHRQPNTSAQVQDQAEDAPVTAFHPGQGWWKRSDGTLEFDDTGRLLPDGSPVGPTRPTPLEKAA